MPFGVHWPELLVVCVIALLVLGPKRLPEMGSAVGKTYREFRKSMSEITTGHREAPAVETIGAPTPAATQIASESTIPSDQSTN